MPYYNRPELRFSLDSYCDLYGNRDDFEVIIVEDSKNKDNEELHNKLLSTIDMYKERLKIRCIIDPKISYNPSSKYNKGTNESSGSILVLTNPEVPHVSDVLSFIDKSDMSNLYIICACKAMHISKFGGCFKDSEFKFYMWYQHTQHRDVRYHFCTVISKDNYNKIKGFDERYCSGIAYDDDNFVKRVQKAGLIMLPVDDLVTYHIEHSRNYEINLEEFNRLVEVNRKIWASQLSTGDF